MQLLGAKSQDDQGTDMSGLLEMFRDHGLDISVVLAMYSAEDIESGNVKAMANGPVVFLLVF